jgi:hypothetical protein
MVVRLAEALEVPLRERNALLLAAGYAPAYPENDFDAPALGAIRGALERVLEGHMPYPAVITDRYGDLVSANGAFEILTEGVARSLLEPPVSVARLFLHPDGIAPRIENLDEWAWHVIVALRREAARNPHERLEALLDELSAVLPEPPRQPGPDHIGFAVPLRLRAPGQLTGSASLRLLTTLTHFGTAVDVTVSELRLEAFLPADDETAESLAAVASACAGTGKG